MKRIDKGCKGCYMIDVCDLNSSYIDPKTSKLIKCPCTTCLVKPMCKSGSPCREYEEYISYIRWYEKYKLHHL